MKIKKLISAFCLAVGLALSVPALTATIGVPASMGTVSAAEGWAEDANGIYYEQNGERLTGLQTIGSNAYYFDANGYRVTGPVKNGDSIYYFTPKKVGKIPAGALLTGKSGLLTNTANKDVYYYLSMKRNGKIVTNKWVKVKGKYFYANANGEIKLGTIKVGKKLYHITKNGRLVGHKKSSYDKKYYYAASNGVLKTGVQKIGKRLYYFNKKTGQRQTGTITSGKYTYYFNTQSGYARTGWIKLGPADNKQYYYYGSNFRQYSGFKTIKGKKYYFNPKNGNAREQNTWCKINGKWYYFNEKGVLQTGFTTIKGKRYYLSSSGVRQKGWKTVNGLKYYMDKKTAVVKTGWFEYNGKKYYLNPNKSSSTYGAAKTGWVKIKGYWYYFNADGSMKTGWLTLTDNNGNITKYYLNPKTGKMTTGTKKIDGTTYKFGTSGKITVSLGGEWLIRVNRKKCVITIYKGSTPVKAMICSTARDGVSTPTGTFRLQDKLRWHELIGPSWGQYCSHITSDILFHSVTYMSYRNNRSLNTSAYNNLGSPASAGCIRLQVIDAKWMYDNLPIGTKVIISDNEPYPLGKPTIKKIPSTQNYDPTDPNI